MNHRTPTPAHTRILELLSAFDYLTTRQVHENLGATTTRWATVHKLRLLEQSGFLQAERVHPEKGAVSELGWRLLRKHADFVEIPLEGSSDEFHAIVTPGQEAILRLLAEMKQLSTTQIWQHLHEDKSKRYTRLWLNRLRKARLARSRQLYPERGAASEHYWMLTKRGASAIGVRYDMRYRRRPERQSVEHRGLLLELGRQVQDAGWLLMHPNSNRHPLLHSEEMPQRRQLVEAVLKREQLAIDALLRRGYSHTRLKERIERCKAGQVGAVVPRVVNEYVAFIPGQPERTALIIPHRPGVGPAFWQRRPGVRRLNESWKDRQGSRLSRYSRLSQIVPVIAVFSSEELARQYAELLAPAGFRQ